MTELADARQPLRDLAPGVALVAAGINVAVGVGSALLSTLVWRSGGVGSSFVPMYLWELAFAAAFLPALRAGLQCLLAAGGYAARYAVGERPNVRVKLVVNEPTLRSPTAKQMSRTARSVSRSSAAARSRRRVSRYACGDSPNARRNSRLKCARERPAARAISATPSGSK